MLIFSTFVYFFKCIIQFVRDIRFPILYFLESFQLLHHVLDQNNFVFYNITQLALLAILSYVENIHLLFLVHLLYIYYFIHIILFTVTTSIPFPICISWLIDIPLLVFYQALPHLLLIFFVLVLIVLLNLVLIESLMYQLQL